MDTVTMNKHFVALKLGRTLEELDSMTVSEYLSWLAFFKEAKVGI